MKKGLSITLFLVFIIGLFVLFLYKSEYSRYILNKKAFKNILVEDNINEEYKKLNIKSNNDYNENGIDDYSDFIIGCRKDAQNHPIYVSDYVPTNNGYPDKTKGVCTDVIWRAMREGGYSLRSMLMKDIRENPEDYPMVKKPDDHIDFRRVKTLRPFFEKYATVLTNELNDPKDFQPGDIIIFGPNDFHIGMCSDNRNEEGFPLIFHNGGQLKREQDYINISPITGHYRFEKDKIPQEVLFKWDEEECNY
ncbi:MAG: DUF1287 domain-containing protein [Lagierella massiliensis]|nr:DUF1287 domain-containing protein [Lagierella massiliensis]